MAVEAKDVAAIIHRKSRSLSGESPWEER